MTGRTTNFQRTIGTLQGVLTGLYPDTREAIPVTTAADLDEVLFANVQGCASLKLAMDAAKKKVQGESVSGVSNRDMLCSRPSRRCTWWQWLGAQQPGSAPATTSAGVHMGQHQGVSPASFSAGVLSHSAGRCSQVLALRQASHRLRNRAAAVVGKPCPFP